MINILKEDFSSSFFPNQKIIRIFSKEGTTKLEVVTIENHHLANLKNQYASKNIDDLMLEELLEIDNKLPTINYLGEITQKVDGEPIVIFKVKGQNRELSSDDEKLFLDNFEIFFSKIIHTMMEKYNEENLETSQN